MKTSRQFLIGPPGSGKTTFLAALWHLVQAAEVPTELRLFKLHGVRTHLNKIRSDWIGCRPLDRTVIGAEEYVAMQLEEPTTGEVAELVLPDLSGESFRLQWKERRWSEEYDQLLQDAVGGLLFVHPAGITEPTRIDVADILIAEIGGDGGVVTNSSLPATPWDADLAPTQVQLVDLLQFVAAHEARTKRSTLRLGIMISAWDLVEGEGRRPREWFSRRLPLLAQYLKANAERFESRVFGVTAQGGELPRDKERLQMFTEHSKRIRIIEEIEESHDLTSPIRWVMG
jgi:hypothetical protein